MPAKLAALFRSAHASGKGAPSKGRRGQAAGRAQLFQEFQKTYGNAYVQEVLLAYGKEPGEPEAASKTGNGAEAAKRPLDSATTVGRPPAGGGAAGTAGGRWPAPRRRALWRLRTRRRRQQARRKANEDWASFENLYLSTVDDTYEQTCT